MKLLYALFHVPCVFHLLTGFYCPGCGGTRAIRFLLRGQLKSSFQYHPLILYATVVLLLELGSVMLSKVTGKPKRYAGHETLLILICTGIILVNWCWKNYMLVVRGIDLLSVRL